MNNPHTLMNMGIFFVIILYYFAVKLVTLCVPVAELPK